MRASAVPSRIPRSQASFLDDVARTLRAWREAPLLPLTTLAIAVPALAAGNDPAWRTAAGLLTLLFLGWVGTQRLWYLRLWTGRTLTLAEAWRANLRCFGRFFVLGLVVGVAFLVLAIPLVVPLAQAFELGPDGMATLPNGLPLWVEVYSALLAVLGYAVLTFVTPAIVYSSRRVRDAIPIGLRLLKVSWPATAAYVLVPAAGASLPGLLGSVDPLQPEGLLAGLVSTLVLALGRGAVSAYYLRTVPGAGPDGDVRLEPEPGYYPPPAWGG